MFSGYKGLIKPPPGTPINPFHPLSQGLVGYWPFNEGTGSRACDISGHGNHGMLKNMSPNAQNSGWGGSKFGGELNFDGSDDYVDCGNDKSLDLTGEFTLSTLVRLNAKHDWQQICGRGYSTSGSYWLAFYNATSRPYAYVDGELFSTAGLAEVSLNVWHNILLSAKVGTNNVKLYIDGVLYAQKTTSTDIIGTSTHDFWIGRDGQTTNYEIDGGIALISAYNRALSATEAKQIYEDPFCNLLRVPVRYVPAAPEIIELLTTISATTSTSAPNVLMLRELASTIAATTSVSAADVDVLRELIATIDTQTGSVATLDVLRELIASIDTTTSLSDIELLTEVLRELSAIIAVATSTSVPDLSVLREMDAAIASTTSMSDADLNVLRELASTIAVTTLLSDIELLVETLRELSATIATVTSTSTPDLNVLRELTSTIVVTTLLSDIELLTEQLRELVTTIATVTSTSTPDLNVLRELEAIIEATTALTTIELTFSMWLTSNPTITRLKSEGWFE